MVERTGVIFVAENVEQFLADLERAREAIAQFGQAASGIGQSISVAATTTDQSTTQIGRAIAQVSQQTVTDVGRTASSFSIMGQTLKANELQFMNLGALARLTNEQLELVTRRVEELSQGWSRGSTTAELYNQALRDLGLSSEQLAQATQTSAQSQQQLTQAAQTSAQSQQQLTQATQTSAQALRTLSTAALIVGGALKATAVSAVTVAARIEELQVLLEVSRQNAIRLAESEGRWADAARLSYDAVQKQIEGIRALHLSGLVAYQTLATLIRYSLDWTKATQLARLAQDSATYAMQDSSQALQGLLTGIITLQPRLMRTYGIMLNLDIAYERYARAHGLVAEKLTVTQRQQAAMDEALRQGVFIQGAYEAAMTTAAKQIRSLRTDLTDLAEAYGRALVPSLQGAVEATRTLIQRFTELPEPVRNTISITGTLTGGFLLAVGAAVKLRAELHKLYQAFIALQAVQTLGLGTVGLIAATVAAVTTGIIAISQYQRAQREAAAEIAASSDTYQEYVNRLEDARLASYKLVLMAVPATRLDHVVLVGQVGVTTPALLALLDEEVGLSLVSRTGKLRGRMSPPTGGACAPTTWAIPSCR